MRQDLAKYHRTALRGTRGADDLVIGVVGAEDAVLVEGDVAVRVLDHLLGRGGSDNITGGLKSLALAKKYGRER